VFVINGLLGAADMVSILNPRLLLKLFRAFLAACRSSCEIEGVNIAPLAREDLLRSFTSPMFFQCLLLDRCLRRVAMENLETLFFRLEFQPLERALLYNTHGRTKTVGFQHSALGKNFLNYVFEEGELGLHAKNQGDARSMPLPDYILTSGEKGVEYLRRWGYPPERHAVAGAVRLGPLYSYRKNIPPRQKLRAQYGIAADKKVIFVATSPLLQETVCMLDDLLQAVTSSPEPVHLVVKCHPNAHAVPGYIRRVRGLMESRRRDVSFDFYTEPIAFYDYIALSDAVLLTGGTVALEAMLLGCVPLIYVNDAQFSHNPLTEYPGAVILVDGRQAMEEALKIINDREAVEKLKRNWEKPLHDMFYDGEQNPNKRFIHVLKNDFRIL
jgi:surface carbohydrate biosynthesis protein (TIGR04326 family)